MRRTTKSFSPVLSHGKFKQIKVKTKIINGSPAPVYKGLEAIECLLSLYVMNKYIKSHVVESIQNVNELIDKGVLTIDSPLIIELKEGLIDWCFENQSKNGEILDRTSIGLIIDKMFADILDVH